MSFYSPALSPYLPYTTQRPTAQAIIDAQRRQNAAHALGPEDPSPTPIPHVFQQTPPLPLSSRLQELLSVQQSPDYNTIFYTPRLFNQDNGLWHDNLQQEHSKITPTTTTTLDFFHTMIDVANTNTSQYPSQPELYDQYGSEMGMGAAVQEQQQQQQQMRSREEEFVSTISDLTACMNTILLPNRLIHMRTHLTMAEKTVADAVFRYSHRFVPNIPNDAKIQLERQYNTQQQLSTTTTTTTKPQPFTTTASQPRPLTQSKLIQLVKSGKPIQPHVSVYESSIAEVTWEYLASLRPGQWFVMHIVNGFFSLLLQRHERLRAKLWANEHIFGPLSSPAPTTTATHTPSKAITPLLTAHALPTFFVLNTQFFSLMTDKATGDLVYKYDLVRRWSSRAKIIVNNLNFLFVPCHANGNHWTILIADIKNRLVCYYDSFGGDDEGRCELLAQYLFDEWVEYGGWNGYLDQQRFQVRTTTNGNPVNNRGLSVGTTPSSLLQFDPAIASISAVTAQFRHPSRIGTIFAPGNNGVYVGYDENGILENNNDNNTNKNNNNNNNNATTTPHHPKSISPLDPSRASIEKCTTMYSPFKWGTVPRIPKQTNGYDCGAFICSYANALSLGVAVHGIRLEDYNQQLELICNEQEQQGRDEEQRRGYTNNQNQSSATTTTTLVSTDPHKAFAQAELTMQMDLGQAGTRTQTGLILPFRQEDMNTFRSMLTLAFINGELPEISL